MLGKAKKYVQDQILLAKLEGLESVGKIVSKVVIAICLMLLALFTIISLSFALAYYLSAVFEEYYLGFLAVAGIYLLFIILVLIFSKSIKHAIINKIISSSLSKPGKQVKKAKEVKKEKDVKILEKDNNVTVIKK